MPITELGVRYAKLSGKEKAAVRAAARRSSNPPKRLMRRMAATVSDRVVDAIYAQLRDNKVVEDEAQNLLDLVNEELAGLYLG